MFVGQRIKWKTHDKQGPYISCDQKLAVDAVEEIKFDKHLKDNVTVLLVILRCIQHIALF